MSSLQSAYLLTQRIGVICGHESFSETRFVFDHPRESHHRRTRALPRLFYPGVSEFGGATVIVVGDSINQRVYEFRLPGQ